ncbi:MAG: DUF302 domain-containing protein [Jatrophihabitans sp.]|nr:MAG: DUF302 domain-containing protein [Jatrophihabitans sp.]
MTDVALRAVVHIPFQDAVTRARAALAEEGFGVLTEIDVAATMKAKLDLDVAPQVILGACNPSLAHRALEVEPSLGVLLPCNVVVRTEDDGATVVEAIDPAAMVSATGNQALAPVAGEVRARLDRVLDSLASSSAATRS